MIWDNLQGEMEKTPDSAHLRPPQQFIKACCQMK